MFSIVTMQMVAIAMTRNDWFDGFFMTEFFIYCESKSTSQEIFQKMQSPESRVLSPGHGFLSLNTKWLEVQVRQLCLRWCRSGDGMQWILR